MPSIHPTFSRVFLPTLHQVSEPVPEGVNIFNIMNLSAPTGSNNVSPLGNWSVLVNPNSTVYAQIRGQFEVREGGDLAIK